MPPNTDEDRRWAPVFVALMKRDEKADFDDELNRLIPDPADKDAFIAWNSTCVAKAYERNFKPPPRDSFVRLVEELNFFFPGDKRKDYSRWREPLAVVPWIPLGSTESALYRLEPDFFCLHARNQYHTDHPRPMSPCFLGVNTNVSPNFPKMGNQPRENVSALTPNWHSRPADANSSSPALHNHDNPNASQSLPSTMPANTDEDRRWAVVQIALIRQDTGLDPTAHAQALDKLLPNPSDQDAFLDWSTKQALKDYRKRFEPMPRDLFISTVEQLNFFFQGDGKRYGKWLAGTEQHNVPMIPLGSTENALYRLLPELYSLQSRNQENSKHPSVKDYCFLGVNTNVKPAFLPMRNRRHENLSEMSTQSAESDDSGIGFMFHQLGNLMTWPIDKGSEPPAEDSPIYAKEWISTGYVVVARLSTSGYADALCLIYNTWPELEDGVGRYEVSSTDWGYLPHEPRGNDHMSFAKLRTGSSLLSDRNYNTRFEWYFEDAEEEAASKRPVELVRLVEKASGDGCLRLTVEHEGRGLSRS